MAILEETGRILGAVREASGAVAVGLYDCDLERLHTSSESSEAAFWKLFFGLSCLDQQQWSRDLHRDGSARVGCTCDLRHAVQTVTVNDRWALLILARGDLAPTAPSVILSSIPPMADLLPLNRMRGKGGSRGGEGPAPAELGIPLWWLRRDQR